MTDSSAGNSGQASTETPPMGENPAEPADEQAQPRLSAPTQSAPKQTPPRQTPARQTLLDQMGGLSGLIYSALPVLVFVLVNSIFGLQPGIWAAVGFGLAICVLRLVRKEPLQPAFSGLFGVAIAAFIAYRTGSAKGFFLFGIWTSLVYCGVFLASAIVRWPLAGVLWSTLNGTGNAWRKDKVARRYYDVATLVWILVFGARFVVQRWLYDADQVGWLAFAKIAMGAPLVAIAFLVTIWAVRKAGQREKQLVAVG